MLLLSMIPFVLLIAGVTLGVFVTAQPETAWNGPARQRLYWSSQLLNAAAMGGMILLTLTSGGIGLLGLFTTVAVVFLMVDAQIRIAGVRSRSQQIEFLWMLAIAVKSGRPLAEEIESYAEGTGGRRQQRLSEMAQRLRDGVPLTELAVPQGLLPRTAGMMITAGISSASLPETLRSTAVRVTRELSEEDESFHATGALIYPATIVPVTLLIVGFLMYYIMPKFKKIFNDFGTELPQATVLLIRTSDAIINFWYVFGLPLFYLPAGMFVFVLMAQYYGWRVMLQSVLGRWFIRWYAPDLMRSLAQTIEQGGRLDQALDAIARHPSPLRLRKRLAWSIDRLRSGDPAWQTLQTAGLLRHDETIVLETAEKTGNLPWALETLATNLECRSAFRIQAILEILRPVLLITVALVVGSITIALFLPLIKLMNDFS